MNNLITIAGIKNTPAKIDFDFEAASIVVDAHLDKFRGIVLVEDTYKDGKELIKEINETRKALDNARKENAKIASEPIREFEAKMKDLIKKHDDLLNDLKEQIARFEDEKKAFISNELNAHLLNQWDFHGVTNEFRRSTAPEPLLGDITAKNKLTAKALDKVKALAFADKMLQVQTESRLNSLELASLKAGLTEPLTRVHIQGFLFADQSEYESKLEELINGEIEREKIIIETHKARIENDLLAKESSKKEEEKASDPTPKEQPQEQPPQPQNFLAQDVYITVRITAKGAAHLSNEVLADALNNKLKEAGITTHEFLTIERF